MNSLLSSIPRWIFSLFLLILLLPVIILILLIVSVVTRQSPVYRQDRTLSLGTSPINIYKIRTIKDGNGFSSLEEKSEKVFNKNEYENHVPAFCRWLRRSGLDEILQLVNVLKGEMQLIGPRPLAEADLLLINRELPGFNEQRALLKSKPGITGCWQVWMDRDKGPANMLELDQYYENNKSLFLDLKIILETINIIFFSRHWDSVIGMSVNSNRLFKLRL
jgi:lipopolysaccharide/colanic/teichoic acid biosynthesis glycosyltransferase